MRSVGSVHLRRADALQELFSVMRELVDRMHMVINDPHVLLRIVRIDCNEMGALQNLVPLRPAFHDISVGVCYNDAVFPLRVNSECA